MTESTTLPEYEELIDSLANRLEGLSVVHRGVGDATSSLVAAQVELTLLQQRLEELLLDSHIALQEIKRLEPERLEASFGQHISALGKQTAENKKQISEQLELVNERVESQNMKVKQFGSLLAVLVNGTTPYQTEVSETNTQINSGVMEIKQRLQHVNSSLESSLRDADIKLSAVEQNQIEFSRGIKDIHTTSLKSLTVAENLSPYITSKFDALQKQHSDEHTELCRLQVFVVILCLAVLISVWLTA